MSATKRRVQWDDLDATVEYAVESHALDATVYEVAGHGPDAAGAFTVPLYERRGGSGSDFVTDLADAAPMVHVMVKWDGCSHYYFGDSDGYLHRCGEKRVRALARIVERLFELGRDTVPSFDRELGR